MSTLDTNSKQILAFQIVLQNMIALMGKDKIDQLSQATTENMDSLISKHPDYAQTYEEVRSAVDELIQSGINLSE